MAGSGRSHEQGKRAGASAPPTPAERLVWPVALENRLQRAGIVTRGKTKHQRKARKKGKH